MLLLFVFARNPQLHLRRSVLSSLLQTFFVLLLLPATTALNGMALHRLPELMAASVRAFMGLDTAAAGAGALVAAAPALGPWGVPLSTPLLALSYVAMNLAFNVSMLTLLRRWVECRTSLWVS